MKRTDFFGLLRLLDRHEIRHVVVGGVAAILEGAPITTLDLDVVFEVETSNLARLEEALAEVEARYRDPAGREIVPTADRLGSHRTNLLETRLGLLDLMQTIGDERTYADLRPHAGIRRVAELEVRVLDLATVIQTKREADREKDRAMLPVLQRTLEMKETESETE